MCVVVPPFDPCFYFAIRSRLWLIELSRNHLEQMSVCKVVDSYTFYFKVAVSEAQQCTSHLISFSIIVFCFCFYNCLNYFNNGYTCFGACTSPISSSYIIICALSDRLTGFLSNQGTKWTSWTISDYFSCSGLKGIFHRCLWINISNHLCSFPVMFYLHNSQ